VAPLRSSPGTIGPWIEPQKDAYIHIFVIYNVDVQPLFPLPISRIARLSTSPTFRYLHHPFSSTNAFSSSKDRHLHRCEHSSRPSLMLVSNIYINGSAVVPSRTALVSLNERAATRSSSSFCRLTRQITKMLRLKAFGGSLRSSQGRQFPGRGDLIPLGLE
jgi:hypothetical protein